MGDETLAAAMRTAATAFLATLGEPELSRARRSFTDAKARRWIEYRPRPRPGSCLADMDRAARKAAHRLLATALSPHAYAQAVTIMALEEVLDRAENWRRNRHSDDYRVVVFGDPGDEQWSWRIEGHHLSVTMTVAGGQVSPAPIFLGANPARVSHGGRAVVRPLAPEEDLGHELLAVMGARARSSAIVAERAPEDIRSAVNPRLEPRIEPAGIAAIDLAPAARQVLDALLSVHLDRLPAPLAAHESARLEGGDLHFAWEGPARPGTRHYYRLQAPDLLIEYDNTSADGNHAHTVLRRPLSDFGEDLLGQHRRIVPHPPV